MDMLYLVWIYELVREWFRIHCSKPLISNTIEEEKKSLAYGSAEYYTVLDFRRIRWDQVHLILLTDSSF